MKRPAYIALDNSGLEYTREAMKISELPQEMQNPALQEATARIAEKVELTPIKTIQLESPVFNCFAGMSRQKAKNHMLAWLLLQKGSEVSLSYCDSYDPATEPPKMAKGKLTSSPP